MRYFNTHGPVEIEEHYVVSRQWLVDQLSGQIDQGKYFTIFAPRQMGKTTLLEKLDDMLTKHHDYVPITLSFEEFERESANNFMEEFAELVEFATTAFAESAATGLAELATTAFGEFAATGGQEGQKHDVFGHVIHDAARGNGHGFHVQAEQEQQEDDADVADIRQQLQVRDQAEAIRTDQRAQGDIGDDQGLARIQRHRGEHRSAAEDEKECKGDR